MSPTPERIAQSRAYCRWIARRAGSSFGPSFLVLGQEKRQAMEALYAFFRHSDDLADGPQPPDQRRAALAGWRRAVSEVIGLGLEGSGFGLQGSGSGSWVLGAGRRQTSEYPPSPVAARPAPAAANVSAGELILPALGQAVQRFQIPAEHLLAVLDGVQMDIDGVPYETFDELAVYCHRVASAVGLACLHIWGFRGQEAYQPARQCGLAFQLTNILRDLKEDAARGRIYLPRAELRQFGYAPEELARGVADHRFDRLMAMQIQRARQFYRMGAELFDWLGPDGRRAIGMMVSIYGGLLERIAVRPREVLARRVRLGRWQRLRILARWRLLPPRRSSLP
ncbi:MAG: phytoene/squalene synthase family protein [Thermoguttaceae bacterium]